MIVRNILQILTMMSLYLMFVAKDKKPNVFIIPLCDQTAMDIMPLFEHVL